MSNTKLRIIAASVMALVACGAATLQYFGIPAVKYLGLVIVLAMIVEYIICLRRADKKDLRKSWITFFRKENMRFLMVVLWLSHILLRGQKC